MEKLMQYVWQHRLWLPTDMVTVDGDAVEVIDPGLLNHDAGPDFFNAKVRINGKLWVGNIEIHVRASDWNRHGHHTDRAYDNVVLHVVYQSDARISRPDGEIIPQVVMPCAADFSESYNAMVGNPTADLPCADVIKRLPGIYITDWLTALAFERMYDKADRVAAAVERFGGDWQQAIYVVLARALGFSTNSDAFERLAAQVPLPALRRHADSPVTVEGALFGQAGFLDNIGVQDEESLAYAEALEREYAFVSHKYNFQQRVPLGWRMGRLRPQNFPQRRLATLAAMVCDGGFSIGYKILAVENEEQARALFDISLQGYWTHRYSFGTPSAAMARALSKASVTTLIINVVIPVLYANGCATGRTELCERAIDMLQSLPPEDNVYIRLFTAAGMACRDAFTSQAMIQLRRNYCQPRKCLYCRIGHRYLSEKAIRRKPQAAATTYF